MPPAPGFPSASNGKESAWNGGDPGLNPGLGRPPGEGNSYPLQYSCLENPIDQRSLVGYSSWGQQRVRHYWTTNFLYWRRVCFTLRVSVPCPNRVQNKARPHDIGCSSSQEWYKSVQGQRREKAMHRAHTLTNWGIAALYRDPLGSTFKCTQYTVSLTIRHTKVVLVTEVP